MMEIKHTDEGNREQISECNSLTREGNMLECRGAGGRVQNEIEPRTITGIDGGRGISVIEKERGHHRYECYDLGISGEENENGEWESGVLCQGSGNNLVLFDEIDVIRNQ